MLKKPILAQSDRKVVKLFRIVHRNDWFWRIEGIYRWQEMNIFNIIMRSAVFVILVFYVDMTKCRLMKDSKRRRSDDNSNADNPVRALRQGVIQCRRTKPHDWFVTQFRVLLYTHLHTRQKYIETTFFFLFIRLLYSPWEKKKHPNKHMLCRYG